MKQKAKAARFTRKPKPTILILTEGETEVNYFKELIRLLNLTSVTVEKSKNQDLAGAIKYAKKERKKDADIIYVVGDFEINPNQKDKQPDQFNDPKVIVCTSNPCFEVWLLLHYVYTTKPFGSCDQVRKELRKFLPGYTKPNIPHELVELRTQAVEYGKKLHKHQNESGLPEEPRLCNPYSDVFLVVEKLAPVAVE
ncbi:MAG: RloB family protein [Candidatus Sumerlaeia bacterium]|nr:RloB family protein [Candidatus Sumerlaeia bacterium]